MAAEINNHSITIINLYAPNNHQIQFLRMVIKKAAELTQGDFIICGDFNDIANPLLDTTSSRRHTYGGFTRMLRDFDLYDAWRCVHGEERDY